MAKAQGRGRGTSQLGSVRLLRSEQFSSGLRNSSRTFSYSSSSETESSDENERTEKHGANNMLTFKVASSKANAAIDLALLTTKSNAWESESETSSPSASEDEDLLAIDRAVAATWSQCTVWVGSIPESMAIEKRLRPMLSPRFGELVSMTVRPKPEVVHGPNKSWAFATFSSPDGVSSALKIGKLTAHVSDGEFCELQMKPVDLETELRKPTTKALALVWRKHELSVIAEERAPSPRYPGGASGSDETNVTLGPSLASRLVHGMKCESLSTSNSQQDNSGSSDSDSSASSSSDGDGPNSPIQAGKEAILRHAALRARDIRYARSVPSSKSSSETDSSEDDSTP